MAQARRDRPRTSSGADEVFLTAFPFVAVAAYLPTIAYNTGGGEDPTWNPIGLLFALAFGATSWPAGATTVLILEVVLVAAVAGAGWWALRRFGVLETLEGKQFEKRIDRLARTMVDPREVDEADPTYLAASTDRLAPAIPATHPGYLGIPLGHTVVGGSHPADDLGIRGHRVRRRPDGQVRIVRYPGDLSRPRGGAGGVEPRRRVLAHRRSPPRVRAGVGVRPPGREHR